MQEIKLSTSELVLNKEGKIYHLNLKPENIADKIILVSDPAWVEKLSSFFDNVDFKVSNREFTTHTGFYKGTRLTVTSTGLGSDNMDIVINEFDALVNIDLKNRVINKEHRSLQFVRIGISGSLQEDLKEGSMILSKIAGGFDGLIHYYRDGYTVCDEKIEKAFIEHTNWFDKRPTPYFVYSDDELFNRFNDGILSGITLSAPGFYGPQNRMLRLPVIDPELINRLVDFRIDGNKIMNMEMESSGLFGMSKLLGHKAVTICGILTNRLTKQVAKDYESMIDKLFKFSLNHI